MQLTYAPYTLKLKHPFGISHTTRTSTNVVLVRLFSKGYIGYGEASLPPYLPETQESVATFLSSLDLSRFQDDPLLEYNNVLEYAENKVLANTAAKAALDIALHDLVTKLLGIPLNQFLGTDKYPDSVNSCTIGIDTPEVVEQKVMEASEFKVLKIKLGADNDEELIKTIRKVTNKPLYVDANQGWADKYLALDRLSMLAENGTVFVEQPMPKHKKDEAGWLSAHSKIPVVADEAFQRFSDLEEVANLYHGINIKLMKCTGLREAMRIHTEARAKKLKILMGCMNESSCATKAAAHLAPACDWVDLDGPFLIKNDPFQGFEMKEGKILLSALPGIGINPVN